MSVRLWLAATDRVADARGFDDDGLHWLMPSTSVAASASQGAGAVAVLQAIERFAGWGALGLDVDDERDRQQLRIVVREIAEGVAALRELLREREASK